MTTPAAILSTARHVSAEEITEMRRRRVEERQPLKQIAFDFGIPFHRASRICRGHSPRPETVSEQVIAAAAAVFSISQDDVRCVRMKSAVGIVKVARRAAAVVMRETCQLTWLETATALNRTNHGTTWKLVERAKTDRVAMQGVERIRALLATLPSVDTARAA